MEWIVAPGRRILQEARDVGVVGDEWFLSLGDAMAGLGQWVGREAGILSGSARAAMGTTIVFTRRLARRASSGTPTDSGPSVGTGADLAPDAAPDSMTPDGPADPLEFPPGGGLDLVAGLPASWRGVEIDGAASDPAGVRPVLEALGTVVAQHERDAFGGLEGDERFWILMDLLNQLARDRGSH